MITFLSPVEIIATNDFSEISCNSFDFQLISNSLYMFDTCILSIVVHIMVLIGTIGLLKLMLGGETFSI